MSAYDILVARNVTRLCHFTKFQSLTNILASPDGILASISIRQDIKNVVDKARYDGELDYVCCSVEYPNSWFMGKVMRANTDKIFRDWVVIYIDLDILKDKKAKFCPCNASRSYGHYIDDNMNNVESIFAHRVLTFEHPRTRKMLDCCPTDGQAEILIKGNVPRKYISGLAVVNEDVADRIHSTLKFYRLEEIPIYIAPDVMTSIWSGMIKSGCRPEEIEFHWLEEE
jgi:hypothetical protein